MSDFHDEEVRTHLYRVSEYLEIIADRLEYVGTSDVVQMLQRMLPVLERMANALERTIPPPTIADCGSP